VLRPQSGSELIDEWSRHAAVIVAASSMDAIVQRLHSKPVVCEARTDNNLLLVFVVPDDVTVRLNDRLQFQQLGLDTAVLIRNATRNQSLSKHDFEAPRTWRRR
jgi:hypothetical protein